VDPESRTTAPRAAGGSARPTAGLPGRGDSRVPTARLAERGRGGAAITRRVRSVGIAAFVLLAMALGLAAALGAFSAGDERKPTPGRTTPAPPPGPPAADPTTGTVTCAGTACTQLGHRVVPPIEGAPCTPQGRAGEWSRIDADGEEPLFVCVPREEAPPGTPPPTTVPDLTGARLDFAEKYLDRVGVDHDTSGGGTFGIIDPGNWAVCTTTPPARSALPPDTAVTLFVDHSC
jgi:hypothetical protein